MNDEEAALFMMTMAALSADDGGGASKGFIESAEPTTATCEVEYADSAEA